MPRKSTLTPEERRERVNTYHREYCRQHPEKTREWRRRYILKRAAQLLAEEQKITGDQSDTRREAAE